MVTWQEMAYLMEGIVFLLMLLLVKEQLISKIYGIRFKKWIEIDTGRHGYTILNKSLNSCKILGQIRTVNMSNVKFNMMYFVSDNVENLKLENDTSKYTAYCNTYEFDTVYKNKLLETLMLSLQNNKLLWILIIVAVIAGLVSYSVYTGQQTTEQIRFIAWKVNQTYVP